jgi:hypothetical protein
MKKHLEVPKENTTDYSERFIKGVLGIVPFAGTALGELFSVVIPPSIEKRRNNWMSEVSTVLNELMSNNANLINDLKDNEEFISLLLETSQLALKTHRDEKLKLFSQALKNSINIDFNFFVKETYIRYIEELNPNQISILNFIHRYQDRIKDVDSFQKYYNLLTKGSVGLSPTIDSTFDITTVRFFMQDLDKKGLILISHSIEELEDLVRENDYITTESKKGDLPYIKITQFGVNFLKMVEEN